MGITRELDKESLLYSYTIDTKSSWSMLTINNPILISIYQPHVFYKDTISYICVLMSHNTVTAIDTSYVGITNKPLTGCNT